MSNVAQLPAVQEPRNNIVAGGKPLAIVPQSMDDAYRLAKAICMAQMAPKGLDTPERCMVAIMHGLEIGLTPMSALQRIAVVNGRPVIWGDGAMGLVRGSGLCEFVRERMDGAGDTRVAICEAKRRGEPEPITRTFGVADAKKAGLWGKQGPWQQYPDRMLQMRARAFALRDGFADVLGGLYIREEIDDAHHEPRDVTPKPPAPPAPPPPPDDLPPAAEATPPAPPAEDKPKTTRRQRQHQAAADRAEGIPSADTDPDGFTKWADGLLATIDDAAALETTFNEQIEPRMTGMFPPAREDVMAIYQKHERRLGGE